MELAVRLIIARVSLLALSLQLELMPVKFPRCKLRATSSTADDANHRRFVRERPANLRVVKISTERSILSLFIERCVLSLNMNGNQRARDNSVYRLKVKLAAVTGRCLSLQSRFFFRVCVCVTRNNFVFVELIKIVFY